MSSDAHEGVEERSVLAPSVEGLVRALRRQPPSRAWEAGDHHAAFEAAASRRPRADGVEIQGVHAGEVAGEWHVPGRRTSAQVLLYLHGGGFIMGSLATTRPLASHLADLTGRRVLVVDYTRAPGRAFPTQVDQTLAAYRWLEGQHVPAEDIILAGDSAGGGLALAAAQVLRDEGAPMPGGLVLLSPLLDLRLRSPSIDDHAQCDPQTPRWLLELMVRCYLGEDGVADDPRVSPLLGDLAGLPPMLIQVAEHEALHDDSVTLSEATRAAGGTAELQVWPGMIHVWHAFAPRVPEAVTAMRAVGAWLDEM